MLKKSLITSISCILLNCVVFYMSVSNLNLSIYIFIIAQMLTVLVITLGNNIFFKRDKTSKDNIILDELIAGNLTRTNNETEENSLGNKLGNYLNSIRKVISEIYGVARIASNTGIYLTRDFNNISYATENIASSVNYMAQGNSEVANSVIKAANNIKC